MIAIINQNRLLAEFQELVQIASPSKKEGQLAKHLQDKLQALGLSVKVDRAGEIIGGETGNIIARLEATGAGPKIFFSAHLDTVMPGESIEPILTDGVFRSAGDTILGADDKSGIVAIMEALRVIKEKSLPHPQITVIFSVAEEAGLLGAINLDTTLLEAEYGFVLDSSGPVGNVIVRGPSQSDIKAVIKGKAAHAGIAPEEGVSAIQIASEAIRRMKLGRIDKETTANIGTINGGIATNIIPEQVTLEGEARSLNKTKLEEQNKQISQAFQSAAKDLGGSCHVEITIAYTAIEDLEQHEIVSLVKRAANTVAMEIKPVATGGGSDANIYNSYGIPTINLATGMDKVHTKEEQIRAEDLIKISNLVLAIIQACGKEL